MPRSRYRELDSQHPHFMTATINNWLPIFSRPEIVEIVLDSWRFLQQTCGLEIFGYVIMENHLHLAARSRNLGADIQRFKAYTAKEILTCLQTRNETVLLNLFEHFKTALTKRNRRIRFGGKAIILKLSSAKRY